MSDALLPRGAGRVHDVLEQRQRHSLDAVFSPETIGATEAPGSVGCALMKNLASFDGAVYPVNPKRASVLRHDPGETEGEAELVL
jgi:hypothetical protein